MDKTKPELPVAENAAGSVILDPDSGRVFVINQTGARIFSALAEGRSIDVIAEEMALTFGVDRDRAKRDAQNLAAELEREGLLARKAGQS